MNGRPLCKQGQNPAYRPSGIFLEWIIVVSSTDQITIELVPAATDDVCALVGELEQILSAEYSPEQRHGLSLDAIFKPHIRFFVAHLNGVAVGCGGVAFFSGFAEVKRMYVRDAVRRRGVGRALLVQLENEARAAGYNCLRLETGDKQIAALEAYKKTGFTVCDVFGDYASMEPHTIATSIFLEKQLQPKAA